VFAYSSILLQEIGFLDHNSHFLLAALSKSLGCTTQIVGERALGMAIERPGSCDTHYIKNKFE
jgi:citrate synthase